MFDNKGIFDYIFRFFTFKQVNKQTEKEKFVVKDQRRNESKQKESERSLNEYERERESKEDDDDDYCLFILKTHTICTFTSDFFFVCDCCFISCFGTPRSNIRIDTKTLYVYVHMQEKKIPFKNVQDLLRLYILSAHM